jgi:hypothetical protein
MEFKSENDKELLFGIRDDFQRLKPEKIEEN